MDMKAKHSSPARAVDGKARHSNRPDDAFAFVTEPSSGVRTTRRDDDAAFFAEEYVASALTGESCNEDVRDEVLDDEEGGFHVVAEEEMLPFAQGEPEADLAIEEAPTNESRASLAHEQQLRGGRWAARGR